MDPNTPKGSSEAFLPQTEFVDATSEPISQELFEGVRHKINHITAPVDAIQKAA